ncbi:hypothetical protein GC163_03540 [bacterium]|nr:hypothetical protein [bacterium]
MFAEGTPFDLQMHLFRIPVRVIPTFWLMAALMGWSPERLDLVFLWVMCVFVSILFHELGHALTAAALGYDPHIVLHHFGGYAAYFPGRDHTPWKSLMITLGGPIPQFMMGLVWFVILVFGMAFIPPTWSDKTHQYLQMVCFSMVYINCGWSLINLLPVMPLDGGQALEAILQLFGLRDARGVALKVGVGVGALTTAGMFQLGMQGAAILFLILTVSSLQELQSRRW